MQYISDPQTADPARCEQGHLNEEETTGKQFINDTLFFNIDISQCAMWRQLTLIQEFIYPLCKSSVCTIKLSSELLISGVVKS